MRAALPITRRALATRLGAMLMALPVLATGRSAAAQQKVSKAEAKYQTQPKGQQRCEICVNFEPPNQCRFVDGQIDKNGWCQFFAAKENAK